MPRCGVERGFESGFQAAVRVRRDQIRNADAAFLESGQKSAPVDFGLGQGATDTEDHTLAVVAPDAVGDEGGAVADDPVDTDFVVGGIDGHVCDLGKRTGAPFGELDVELLVEVGDLSGGDLEATHLLHDSGDAAGADTLDIHCGDG